MIIAAFDVVYVGATVGASLPIGFDLLALSAGSGFDDSNKFGPVVGQMLTSIRSDPLAWHGYWLYALSPGALPAEKPVARW